LVEVDAQGSRGGGIKVSPRIDHHERAGVVPQRFPGDPQSEQAGPRTVVRSQPFDQRTTLQAFTRQYVIQFHQPCGKPARRSGDWNLQPAGCGPLQRAAGCIAANAFRKDRRFRLNLLFFKGFCPSRGSRTGPLRLFQPAELTGQVLNRLIAARLSLRGGSTTHDE